jgi:hypothetical protein
LAFNATEGRGIMFNFFKYFGFGAGNEGRTASEEYVGDYSYSPHIYFFIVRLSFY